MRKNIVAGNWKMNLDHAAGLQLFSEIMNLVNDEANGDQQVVVCAPFIHLTGIAQFLKLNSRIALGAQNCHQADFGAYTGEISASMVKSAGASFVIVGHSERRAYFHENSQILSAKIESVLKHDLVPIFCVGESLEERESASHFDVISKQLTDAAFHLEASQFAKLVIAYEPVWAIGTGLTASPDQAQEVHAFIRDLIARRYSQDFAENITILYGGSCNPANAAELFAQRDIDGGLIGGASLKARDFTDIVKVFNTDAH